MVIPFDQKEQDAKDASDERERLRVFEIEVRAALERKSLHDVRTALRKLDVADSVASRKGKR